jgi:hypothetical protein
MTRLVRRAGIPVVAALVLALGACGQQSEKVPDRATLDTFVGQVNDSPAYIALITDGERVAGFVSDGKRYGKWFATADLDDDEAELIARDGAELGEVSINGDSASGDVIVGLRSHSFEAQRATDKAGLFTAAEKKRQDSFEAGWVVLADGSERGTYDTYIDGEFKTHPAPTLKPTVDIPSFGAQAPHQQPTLFLESNTQA